MSSGYIDLPAFGDVHWKAPVPTATALPTLNNQPGDVRATLDTETLYIWTGVTWEALTGAGGGGTVTDISIATANGFAGTVANPTTTPVLTLETTVTGILNGNGTSVAAAIAANFPTLNQNTTGTASNITASSNSTLTTLSSLVLPTSQLSGTISLTTQASGTLQAAQFPALTGDVTTTAGSLATSLVATTNSTITTLSSLSLPASQLTGKGNLTDAGTDGITVTGGTGAVIGTGTSLAQHVADSTHNGYLSSTDWTTFNNKQSALTFSDSLVNNSGTVTLVNDSASPGFSQYYGTNAGGTFGYFSFPSTTGANTALSNLASVAVNLSLIPGSNNSIDLGSTANTWRTAYAGTSVITPLITGVATAGTLTLRGGVAASNGNGGQVTVTGAAGDGTGSGGAGGAANLTGGAANGDNTQNQSGGAISVTAGNSKGSATGGTVTISSGNGGVGTSTAGATGGTTNVNGGTGGAGSATSGNGGGFTGKAGSGGGGVAGGAGGTAQLVGGTGGTGSGSGGNGGPANLSGGSPGSNANAQGGSCTVQAGNGSGTGAGGAGGTVTITTGTAGGDNTQNNSGGSLTMSVGHSMGSSSGAAVTITAGVGGVGTSTTGATGGNTNINAGNGGVGSATGGGGGNVVISAGTGGNSASPGTGGFIQFLPAATTSAAERFRITSTECFASNSQLEVKTAGFGLGITHGSNCKLGTSTLSGGTVTVSNTAVTANSLIFLTIQSPGGTIGSVYVSAKTANTSFVITSSSAIDTSTVAWLIIEAI